MLLSYPSCFKHHPADALLRMHRKNPSGNTAINGIKKEPNAD